MALNYLGASDKAIKLSFFPILMRAFQNWPNKSHSIASPCFHTVSFASKFIGNLSIYKYSILLNILKLYIAILFYSETKIILFYLFIFAFIRFHLLYHSLASVVIIATRCTTRCHSLSFVASRCH